MTSFWIANGAVIPRLAKGARDRARYAEIGERHVVLLLM